MSSETAHSERVSKTGNSFECRIRGNFVSVDSKEIYGKGEKMAQGVEGEASGPHKDISIT